LRFPQPLSAVDGRALMHRLPATYDARVVEGETRAFWNSRSLPPSTGAFGPAAGRLMRVVSGPVPYGTPPLSDALRLARVDAEVRVLELLGLRSYGCLRVPLVDATEGDAPDPAQLFGVWLGGGALHRHDPGEAEGRREAMERLATDGLLVTVSVPVRVCASCRKPHSPQSVIHQEEEGSAYLVRFGLQGVDPPTSLLVWTDRAWKLLATTALLVSPSRRYAVVRHRRKGVEERLVVLTKVVAELQQALPDSEFEILEERPGSSFAGSVYSHPLAMELPAVAQLPPPGGTVVPAKELEETGTGILALTPAHGIADAAVARELQIPGWPIVGVDGVMTRTVQHKYSGLPLLDAEAFILRDLIDDGAIFAQLPVRRGVPRCANCGTSLFWTPARLWSLSPDRLPADRQQLYQRVLPGEPAPVSASVMPWPISEYAIAEPGAGTGLSECPLCERLGPATAIGTCACGGSRTLVRRRLLPEFEEALAAWSTPEPFPDGTEVRLIVPDRRRGPTLMHHLIAMHANRRRVGELRLVALPALPSVGAALAPAEPLDALRSALLRTTNLPAGRATLEGNRRQEAARLRRAWQTCGMILELFESSGWREDPGPIATQLSNLLEEDRAFLSIFERMRVSVLRSFEAGDLAAGLDRLLRFFETDLRRGYLRLVASRVAAPGSPPAKISVLRTLAHVVPLWVKLYAPGAPFTAEALWRAFRGDASSVGEVVALPPTETMLDADAEASYARWCTVRTALDRSRRRFGLAPAVRLPTVVLVVRDEELASKLRHQVQAMARIVNAELVAVASPEQPWEGRKIEVRPILPEIQRAFGLQTPRVVRMLSGLPLRRVQEGIRAGAISLALEGNTVTLTPSMIDVAEGLPDGTVPIPWSGGELFVTLPEGARPESIHPPPALSLDGYRVLRAIERRVRPLPPDTTVTEVVVRATGPLGQELAKQSAAVARFLHAQRFRLAESSEFLPERETTHGRTGRGAAWSIWMPGIAKPIPTPRTPRRHSGMSRAPLSPEFSVVPEEQLEFISEGLRERERQIRELLEKLDGSAMVPILGMTKLGGLWDLGHHSPEEIAAAPFEAIESLPGFGRIVASELVRAVGGHPPLPPPPRRKPRRSSPEARGPGRVSVTVEEALGTGAARARIPEPLRQAGVPRTVVAGVPLPLEVGPPSVVPVSIPVPETAPVPPSGPTSAPPLPGSSDVPRAAELSPIAEPSEPAEPLELRAESGSAETSEPIAEPEGAETPEIPSGPESGETAEPPAETEFAGPPEPADDLESEVSLAPPEERDAAGSPPSAAERAVVGSPAMETEPELGGSSQEIVASEVAGASEGTELPADPGAGGPPGLPGPVTESERAGGLAPPETPESTESEPEFVLAEEPDLPAQTDSTVMIEESTPPAPVVFEELPEPSPPAAPEPEASEDATTPAPNPVARLPRASEELVGTPDIAAPKIPSPEPGSEGSVDPGTVALASPEAIAPSASIASPLDALPVELIPVPPAPEEGIQLRSTMESESVWTRFLEATAAGHRGLCLTREFPDRVRLYLGSRDVEVVWISPVARAGSLRPSDLTGIAQKIHTAIDGRGATAVYFEGIEYLVSLHSAEKALAPLRELDRVARQHHARIWIPINPDLLQGPELERLLSEFSTPSG
jgi:hypothetical protein